MQSLPRTIEHSSRSVRELARKLAMLSFSLCAFLLLTIDLRNTLDRSLLSEARNYLYASFLLPIDLRNTLDRSL